MTITRDDIRAAVGAGKISEAQATAIVALSDARRGARENLQGLDEPFELFKGFNEIFIVVGLTILYAGWTGLTGVTTFLATSSMTSLLLCGITGMAALVALAAYFTRRRRMIAPSIALAIMFAFSAIQAGWAVSYWMVPENGIPKVTGDWVAMSSEFADDLDEILVAFIVEGKVRVRVTVVIDDVADGPEVTTAGDVY